MKIAADRHSKSRLHSCCDVSRKSLPRVRKSESLDEMAEAILDSTADRGRIVADVDRRFTLAMFEANHGMDRGFSICPLVRVAPCTTVAVSVDVCLPAANGVAASVEAARRLLGNAWILARKSCSAGSGQSLRNRDCGADVRQNSISKVCFSRSSFDSILTVSRTRCAPPGTRIRTSTAPSTTANFSSALNRIS